MLLDIGSWIVEKITSLIGNVLYKTIGQIIILLLDWLQSIFRGLAGLEGMRIDGVAVNGEGQESYDLAYWLISTDIIMDVFWSMVLFAAFLLIIMTVLAIIRNTYEEKQKPVWDIISASFKGLLGFIIVPAFAVLGLMFSNVILRAVDAGTSFGNSTKMSTNLFMSAAYDANRLRQEDVDDCRKAFEDIIDKTNFEDYEDVGTYYANIGTLTLSDYNNVLARKLDDAFTAEKLVKTNTGDTLSPYKCYQVHTCYNTWEINYIILLAGGCTLIGVFFKMCWGMIGRVFKLCFDFVLIPVVNAMMPFDNGNAMKSWKGDFVKNVTMAYGTVGALNLYFSILPIVNKIEFNNGGLQSTGFFNSIFKLMISIVGVFSANSIIKTVNGWFGVGDVLAEGDSTFKAFQGGMKSIKSGFGVKDKLKKGAKTAMSMQGAFLGGMKASNAKGMKAFGAGLMGAFSQTNAGKTMQELNWVKNVNEGKKKGGDAIKEARTYSPSTARDLWSTGTDATDERIAILDLEKAGKGMSKQYGEMEAKLSTLTPGTEDYKKLEKRLIKAKANDPAIQRLKNGGQQITVNGETKKITAFEDEVTERESDLSKAETGQQSVEAYGAAKSSYASKQMSLSKVGGFDSNKFEKYVRGEISDASLVTGGTITSEQEDMLNDARSEYRTMMNNSLNSIVSVYQAKKAAFVGKSYHGNTLNESYIKGITDPAEALGVLEYMNSFIRDYGAVSRQIAAKNKAEKESIKTFKEDIDKAKAAITSNIEAGNGAGYAKEYSDGGKG